MCPDSEAQQVAMWLVDVTVGSFIVMRHEYATCPYVPKCLKDASGEYIGPVYAIGVVTKCVVPNSAEDQAIGKLIPEVGATWCHTLYRVNFRWMGLKSALQPATVAYLGKVCQPTVAKICEPGKKWPRIGTDANRVRNDLWKNATWAINSKDFDDHFGTAIAPDNGCAGTLAIDVDG